MGGWTVLAAATAMPNDYKSMVLEGSSTGKPFAAEGTPGWPLQCGAGVAQYEEFSNLMWGVDRARDVTQSPKLWPCSAPTAQSNPQALWRHRAGHRKGCSIRPRSRIPPSIFRMKPSAYSSTGSPGRYRAARRVHPTIKSGSLRRSVR